MPEIALIRHTAPLVAPGICYGRLDLALRDAADIAPIVGQLAAFLPARVCTSPARRCRELAYAISADPILDDRLRELDFGAWEGLPWDAIPRADLDRWAADPAGFAPPGGETGHALLSRVKSFHADLIATDVKKIVVSHGGPLKILQALLAGREPDLLAASPPLGSITIYQIVEHAANFYTHSLTVAESFE
jgi:alpha-ribazole phosphatase